MNPGAGGPVGAQQAVPAGAAYWGRPFSLSEGVSVPTRTVTSGRGEIVIQTLMNTWKSLPGSRGDPTQRGEKLAPRPTQWAPKGRPGPAGQVRGARLSLNFREASNYVPVGHTRPKNSSWFLKS